MNNKTPNNTNMRRLLAKLFQSRSHLFASILSQIERIETSGIPTAAVGLNEEKTRIALYWNPEFFSSLTEPQALDVLRHEAMHIVGGHLFRMDNKDAGKWNIGTDMAINQFLKDLPEGSITLKEGWEPRRAADYYYDKVMEDPDYDEESSQQGGEGCGQQSGDHSMWQDVSDSGAVARKAEEMVEEQIVKSAKAGDSTARKLVSTRVAPPSRSWVADIRRMFEPTIRDISYKTNRFDRRRTYHNGEDMIPAKVSTPQKPKVFVALDTSASITEAEISQFLGEVSAVSKDAETVLLTFDVEIQQEVVWGGVKTDFEVEGRGGTSFACLFERLSKERESRNMIILTDGYADLGFDVPPRSRVLWAITENGNRGSNFPGSVTNLKF